LHLAVVEKEKELVQLLINTFGKNINYSLKNKNSKTVEDLAKSIGYNAIADIISKAKKKV